MSILHEAATQLQSIRGGALTSVFGLLIDTALKGSLLIAAAAIAAYALRGRSASARHAAWSAAVIGHLALPVLTLLAPQWRLPILPAPPWLDTGVSARAVTPTSSLVLDSIHQLTGPMNVAIDASSLSPSVPATTPSIVMTDRAKLPAQTPTKCPLLSILGLLWILGSLLVLARLAFGTWRVGRLAKQGDRVADGEWLSLTQRLANRLNITRPLTLLRGESLAVPVTWGVVYPAVLLPPDADQWPEARRRFVLVHEMAHVKRFDALTQLLAQFAIAILWFDPLIWLAAHRMRVEREHACDDYVLRDGTTPSLYAGELLEMVQSIGSPRHESAAPAFAALAMARRSEFEGRMLAILDPKQERHTLGRRSAVAATIMLAILVVPLAALRPFHNVSPSSPIVASSSNASPSSPVGTKRLKMLRENLCDSVVSAPARRTSSHIHADDSEDGSIIELLTTTPNSCAQAEIIGKALYLDDRIVSLGPDAYASFEEITPDAARRVVVTSDNGALRYAASKHGKAAAYDDDMRAWMRGFVPVVLREAGVEVEARVARDREKGGVAEVLADIAQIKSTSAKRMHYEALLHGAPLAKGEYDRVARQAGRELASAPTDLDAVLTLMSAGPTSGLRALERAVGKLAAAQQTMQDALGTALGQSKTGADTIKTLKEYADTDDPSIILMALKGASDMSSDSDKRTLLQMLAPRALGKRNSELRIAFFNVLGDFSSDSDVRVVLQDALTYAPRDSEITISVLRAVQNLSSDSDKRVVMTTAAHAGLINNAAARNAYMSAAKSLSNSTDYTVVIQALLKQ